MRVARLLSIVFEVEAHPGITAGTLARALGVSVRTVHRDVEALRSAGVPVYGTAGHGGGLRLVEGYRSRAASLHAEEASALLAGVVPGLAHQLGLGRDADRAHRKVRAQAGADGEGASVLVDPVGWYRAPQEAPHLALVAASMRSRTLLSIRYSRWVEPTRVRRDIAPLGLVLKAGTWYVMARSRGAVRTYRVDQIRSATPTTTPFEPDPGFDLAAGWSAFVESFHDRLVVGTARVRLSRAGRDRCRSEGDAFVLAAIDTALGAGPEHEHPLEVQLPYESVERATGDLLRLGVEVEVLGPRALLDHFAGTVRDLAGRYGRD